MERTVVIGDIHGCLDSLNNLLDLVLPNADTLIFLGDYVDRGPDSYGVVERLLALQADHPRLITLKGNHDFMFQQYFDGKESSLFLRVGGKETLTSYGIPPEASAALASIPAAHTHFFRELPLFFENQHAIYVHAGLEPECHLSLQSPQWCLWAREKFLNSSFQLGKPIIFGHTVFPRPYIAKDKIGIDTGAVYGGQLTALILPDMEYISVPGELNKPYIAP
ncbi:metallophosphoesterase family protein [Desulfogranum marinum]|uniref:metallophosphoesterase family protein n=1 Tax=Desulfogranum marinum TaxID=453220 RepID=UPI0029C865DE|nr:metallophosphoesterase family protein [Desulfogranum marinum]